MCRGWVKENNAHAPKSLSSQGLSKGVVTIPVAPWSMPDSLGFHECGDPCGAPDGYTYNKYMGEGGRGAIHQPSMVSMGATISPSPLILSLTFLSS